MFNYSHSWMLILTRAIRGTGWPKFTYINFQCFFFAKFFQVSYDFFIYFFISSTLEEKKFVSALAHGTFADSYTRRNLFLESY